jgi:hypothetical protein
MREAQQLRSKLAGVATVALLLLAAVRGLALLTAEPLVALANSYDQIRYTACFALAPAVEDRDPTAGSPDAPYSRYAFRDLPGADCSWSSDLLFQGIAAASFRATEALTDRRLHSVRWLGALRWAAWIAVGALLARALREAGRPGLALGSAVWVAFLGFDPANSLYLATFYAENGALFFATATVGSAILATVRATPLRLAALTLAAAGLGSSKLQHAALPLALALVVALSLRGSGRRGRTVALSLALGGALALALHGAQLLRTTPGAASRALANRTNLVSTALLPAASDPVRVAAALGLGEGCAALSGKPYWAVERDLDRLCPGIANVGRARVVALLAVEPKLLGRLLVRVPGKLLPWTPPFLGAVEGGERAPLPDRFVSINRWHGFAGFAKHCHLATNAGLAQLLAVGGLVVSRAGARERLRRWR